MAKYKAYLIDPFARTIEETTWDDTDLTSIYKQLQCQVINAVRISREGDHIYIDANGHLVPADKQMFFFLPDLCPQPLAGRGLVVGCRQDGEAQDPTVTLEWIRGHVCFEVEESSKETNKHLH